MAFCEEHVDVLVVIVVREIRIEEFGQVAIGLFEHDCLLIIYEGGELQWRLLEGERLERAIVAEGLALAILKDQRGLAFDLGDEGGLGDVGRFVRRIPSVVRHEESDL
jgi:hypothetical protein